MPVKDKLLSWYIEKVLIPKQEILDVPGYITEEITEEGKSYKIRDVLLPESVFVELEKRLVQVYKDKGKEALYSTGKRFGYRYASILNLPKYVDSKSFGLSWIVSYADFLVRYMEAVYASRLKHKIDKSAKTFSLEMWDYIVCRKSGLGFIFSSGACAGIWAWVEDEQNIEGVQTKCQGRGDKNCELICAPYDLLIKRGITPLRCLDLKDLKLEEEYPEFNKVISAEYSRHSLQDLIDLGSFSYRHGKITHEDDRYLLCESSIFYLLELAITKLEGADKTLWEAGYAFGGNFARAHPTESPEEVISDFFGAFGFGDVLMPQSQKAPDLYITNFPWTKWSKTSEFILIRAMLSGMLSEYRKTEVRLKVRESGFTENGTFYLHLS